MGRPKSPAPRTSIANVRLTSVERAQMEADYRTLGFGSLSEYVRFLHATHRQRESSHGRASDVLQEYTCPRQFHSTTRGAMFQGDSLGLVHRTLEPNSIDLIMTSPPFGLVRKKSYGNEDADEYLKWFRPFAEGFKRVLHPKGSLVIDIGGSWKPGIPVRSLYHFELLIMLCRDYGFHLCQEHFWWNPAKLPTPAEWVNIRRVRVKDAVNTIWWLSKTPWPKASNKRVLAPYSEAMEYLLKNGYKAKLRPSGHDISENFSKRNVGSVPPNLLAVANTESNGRYQAYCKEHGIDPHPARYPATLPEYFIRMLTDAGDTVLDPFAGSCVTGEVAESLGRRWICCELDENYLEGALGRFLNRNGNGGAKAVKYAIYQPCALEISDDEPLSPDGGSVRPSCAVQPAERAPQHRRQHKGGAADSVALSRRTRAL
ncbi:MAG: site-specific DNA-methyltransferase [bacterium]|nr:site-specific DNA-methyltransferase [bacterium]